MSRTNYPYKGFFKITSCYGYRIDPITNEAGAWHGGLDLVGEDKAVFSVSSGTVIRSRIVSDKNDRTSEWGNYIAIQADGGEIVYYCHLAKRLVEVGERISDGQLIAVEGSSGKSTGSHLHFEVRRNDRQINAAEYLGIPNITGYEHIQSCNSSALHDWAEDAVKWADENGILKGDEHGNFKLSSSCTREEAVVFLFRLYDLILNLIKGEKI